MKQWKNKRIEARSFARNISRVGRCIGVPRWDKDELISKNSR
jgi:hypothetical protein